MPGSPGPPRCPLVPSARSLAASSTAAGVGITTPAIMSPHPGDVLCLGDAGDEEVADLLVGRVDLQHADLGHDVLGVKVTFLPDAANKSSTSSYADLLPATMMLVTPAPARASMPALWVITFLLPPSVPPVSSTMSGRMVLDLADLRRG